MQTTQQYKTCPACRQPAPLSAAYCGHCGRHYHARPPKPQRGVRFLQFFLYAIGAAWLLVFTLNFEWWLMLCRVVTLLVASLFGG